MSKNGLAGATLADCHDVKKSENRIGPPTAITFAEACPTYAAERALTRVFARAIDDLAAPLLWHPTVRGNRDAPRSARAFGPR